MPMIYPNCSKDMPKICPRYAHDMPMICPRYPQDIWYSCESGGSSGSGWADRPSGSGRSGGPGGFGEPGSKITPKACQQFWMGSKKRAPPASQSNSIQSINRSTISRDETLQICCKTLLSSCGVSTTYCRGFLIQISAQATTYISFNWHVQQLELVKSKTLAKSFYCHIKVMIVGWKTYFSESF